MVEIIDYGMRNPTQVLSGIVMGLVAALLWQRFHRIELPSWLAFFGGRRVVPIITAIVALLIGVLFGWLWAALGEWIPHAGEALTAIGPIGTGIDELINRLLIPLGLHHVLNTIERRQVQHTRAGADRRVRAGVPGALLRVVHRTDPLPGPPHARPRTRPSSGRPMWTPLRARNGAQPTKRAIQLRRIFFSRRDEKRPRLGKLVTAVFLGRAENSL
ncbi:PTS transporter subunit EIIC [Nonomuraea diastatica]|uniref:PTS transporter subunit EIIC n=1 Tax=Nonomuraea diastatica TaxID=1848329 RepID=UPI001FEA8CE9|nr:PTS transporter subunit EIIC [Nonomuraea diastatica]